jgi:hypothetical protein
MNLFSRSPVPVLALLMAGACLMPACGRHVQEASGWPPFVVIPQSDLIAEADFSDSVAATAIVTRFVRPSLAGGEGDEGGEVSRRGDRPPPSRGDRPMRAGDMRRASVGRVLPPRLVLRVVFTNTGITPVEFTVREVNSALGNFAPIPERVQLNPGDRMELEPMLSSLERPLTELELSLAIRSGDGIERRVLVLEPRAEETAQTVE